MADRRPLYELDHGAPWGLEDLRAGTAALAAVVVALALLAIALEL